MHVFLWLSGRALCQQYKDCGFDSQGTHVLTKKKCIAWIWIKASAKCINVYVTAIYLSLSNTDVKVQFCFAARHHATNYSKRLILLYWDHVYVKVPQWLLWKCVLRREVVLVSGPLVLAVIRRRLENDAPVLSLILLDAFPTTAQWLDCYCDKNHHFPICFWEGCTVKRSPPTLQIVCSPLGFF